MGGKQLEIFKFLLYLSLPIGATFYVLQPSFIEEVQKRGVSHTSVEGGAKEREEGGCFK
jgi:hypothetical protein